jgi:uncharacterized protein involved in cysteine biosynthesis
VALTLVFSSFSKAVSQALDPAFRAVLLKGIALAIGFLVVVFLTIGQLANWFFAGTISIPFIGDFETSAAISIASIFMSLVLSVFLMVPVASLMSSFFIDDVAKAVETKHYPHLPNATPTSFSQSLRDTANFLGLIIVANMFALILYLLFAPFAPLIFWSVNGYLLGREYFQLVAARRVGRADAKRLWRKHIGTLWIAGICMAAPLSIPLANLFVPILAAATFTHLFYSLNSVPYAGTNLDHEL